MSKGSAKPITTRGARRGGALIQVMLETKAAVAEQKTVSLFLSTIGGPALRLMTLSLRATKFLRARP